MKLLKTFHEVENINKNVVNCAKIRFTNLNGVRAPERIESESLGELVVDEVQPDLELLVVVAHEHVLHERGKALLQPQICPPLLENKSLKFFRNLK